MEVRIRYACLFGALLLSACLQDVTVGFDTQELVGEGRDAGTGSERDASQAGDAGLDGVGDGQVHLPVDGGSNSEHDGSLPNETSCPAEECPLDPEQGVQTQGPCPNEEDRVCERDGSGTCVLRCPEPAPDFRCGGVQLVAKPSACGTDTFCLLDFGSCDPSVMGMCTVRPTVCVKESDPVCGCDGVTYENACEAFRRAVSLRGMGACP